eukprot:UN03346
MNPQTTIFEKAKLFPGFPKQYVKFDLTFLPRGSMEIHDLSIFQRSPGRGSIVFFFLQIVTKNFSQKQTAFFFLRKTRIHSSLPSFDLKLTLTRF